MSNHSSEVRELWQWLIRTEALSIPLGKVHNLPELSLRTTTLQWTQPRLSRALPHNNLQLYETKIWWLLQLLIRLNSLLYNTKPTAICETRPPKINAQHLNFTLMMLTTTTETMRVKTQVSHFDQGFLIQRVCQARQCMAYFFFHALWYGELECAHTCRGKAADNEEVCVCVWEREKERAHAGEREVLFGKLQWRR